MKCSDLQARLAGSALSGYFVGEGMGLFVKGDWVGYSEDHPT